MPTHVPAKDTLTSERHFRNADSLKLRCQVFCIGRFRGHLETRALRLPLKSALVPKDKRIRFPANPSKPALSDYESTCLHVAQEQGDSSLQVSLQRFSIST